MSRDEDLATFDPENPGGDGTRTRVADRPSPAAGGAFAEPSREPRQLATRTQPSIENLIYTIASDESRTGGPLQLAPPLPEPWYRRRRVVAALTAAAVLAVGVAIGEFLMPPGAPGPSPGPVAVSSPPAGPTVAPPPPLPPAVPVPTPAPPPTPIVPVDPAPARRSPPRSEPAPEPAPAPVEAPTPTPAPPVPAAEPAPVAEPAPRPAAVPAPPAVEVSAAERLGVVRQNVDRTVRAYAESFKSLDRAAVASLWPGVDTRDLERAFQSVRSQEMVIDNCDISSDGGRASARCTGALTYVPRVGSPKARSRRVRWDFQFVERGTAWVIERVLAAPLP